MKKLLRKITFSVLTLSLLVSGMNMAAAYAKDGNTAAFIVGDSTACIYGNDDDYALPRAGWGMYLEDYLNDNIEIVNLALAGRSSKSFTKEDNYQTLLNEMEEGDFLIIQFGHNDEKNTKEEDILNRYTDPKGDKDTEGSFRNSLYENYIKPAQEKGVYPVLLSPVSRRKFDDNKMIVDTHGDYDDAVVKLALELNIPFVDMTTITAEYYNNLGFKDSKALHALYNDRNKGELGYDNTHFNHYGARVIAGIFAKALENTDYELKKYVNDSYFTSKGNINITRGEYVDMLVRILGKNSDIEEKDNFADVPESSPYYNSIAVVKKLKISTGDEFQNFRPRDFLTRQELMVFTERALRSTGLLRDASENYLIQYPDAEEVSYYARPSVAKMLLNDFSEGINGKIMPNQAVTREEAASYMYKIYDLISSNMQIGNTSMQSIDELEKVEDTR